MQQKKFQLRSEFEPKGDQPRAIEQVCQAVGEGKKHHVLLGVTGSGKTFTLANIINKLNKPTIIMAPNKTLAAQLYEEFKEFFPENAVEYFVSYYDYYQPEAYVPVTDTFIEKDSSINEEIDRMRHAATHSLLTRNDVIIVTSVSFIYGLGSPEAYHDLIVTIYDQMEKPRKDFLRELVDIQYERNDVDFHRGTFRVRGDTVEIFPAYEEEKALRIEFFGDTIDAITEVDPLRGLPIRKLKTASIYPASHYVTEAETRKRAVESIMIELRDRINQLKQLGKETEAKRLEQRTLYDVEMLEELGYCQGVENYSRHLTGRGPGEAPPTLMEYVPDDFIMVLDESHVSVPQLGGMYRGDRARKMNLVEYGFRLPSALDNRPLNFEEFNQIVDSKACSTIYVSATPADYELKRAGGEVVEQIIRPTGLLDPEIDLRPATTQVDDVLGEIRARTEGKPEEERTRVLITVLTKRMAEDLTTYLLKQNVRVKYMHSDVETLERIEILKDLRLGTFDVLVGINLLREGLDLPEVSLVAIFDADKEGFLRSERSLIQTIGRAARNAEGRVILYADKMTKSMEFAISETKRRRELQNKYNEEHGITPKTVRKSIKSWDEVRDDKVPQSEKDAIELVVEENLKTLKDVRNALDEWQKRMLEAAKERNYEDAAQYRDKIKALKKLELTMLGSRG